MEVSCYGMCCAAPVGSVTVWTRAERAQEADSDAFKVTATETAQRTKNREMPARKRESRLVLHGKTSWNLLKKYGTLLSLTTKIFMESFFQELSLQSPGLWIFWDQMGLLTLEMMYWFQKRELPAFDAWWGQLMCREVIAEAQGKIKSTYSRFVF